MKEESNNITAPIIGIIKSNSMYPTLKIKQKILINKVARCEIEVGDVLGFLSERNNILVHRVVKKLPNKLLTIADANTKKDKEISVDKVVGRLVYTKEDDKWIGFQNSMISKLIGKCIAHFSLMVVNFPNNKLLFNARYYLVKYSSWSRVNSL